MRGQLVKVLERNQLVDMMYVSKSGAISQRRINITKISDNSFVAYCFKENAIRTFLIKNVLALIPVTRKGRGVI